MSQLLLEDGYYIGRIINYGVKLSSKGDPSPTVKFEVKDSAGVSHFVFWQASFNGGALDKTLEALLVMGLENSSRLSELADGVESGVLDNSRDYQLTIETEVNQQDPSKKYNKVRWINAESGAKLKDAISKDQFAPLIEGRNLTAELLRVAELKGYALSSTPILRKAPSNEHIPF